MSNELANLFISLDLAVAVQVVVQELGVLHRQGRGRLYIDIICIVPSIIRPIIECAAGDVDRRALGNDHVGRAQVHRLGRRLSCALVPVEHPPGPHRTDCKRTNRESLGARLLHRCRSVSEALACAP